MSMRPEGKTMSFRILSKLNVSLKNHLMSLNRKYSILNDAIKKNIDSNDVKFEESIIVEQDFINEDEEKKILLEIGGFFYVLIKSTLFYFCSLLKSRI